MSLIRSTAASSESLMTVYWYSPARSISRRATSSRRWIASSDSVPRDRSRRSSSCFGAGVEEDRQDAGKQVTDLGRPVDVDIQDNPFWVPAARRDLRQQRAVPVSAAENLEAFEEFAGLPPAGKLVGRRGNSSRRHPARPAAASASSPKRSAATASETARSAAAAASLADARRAGEDDELGGGGLDRTWRLRTSSHKEATKSQRRRFLSLLRAFPCAICISTPRFESARGCVPARS